MDYDFRRPHRRTSAARQLAPSFAAAQPHVVQASAMLVGSSSASVATQAPAQTGLVPAEIKHLDFASGAKAHKRRVMRTGILQGFAISLYIMAGFACLLAAGGFYVNHKYAGRSLPFTYVGDMSIGGLNEAQIKAGLDARASDMQITFIDGGLVRKVPASQFAAKFDTATIAYQATHRKFDPFAYLNKHRYDAPVTINERQINGYLTTTINSTKTASESARLVIEKNKLKIVPETQGFRTNPQFVTDRIKVALTSMTNPVINVNAVTIKPAVYATDLEDDLARANTLLNAAIVLQYGKTNIKPSFEEKLSWLQIAETPNADNVTLTFSKALVRQYVVAQANRFQASSGANATGADTMTLVTQKGTVINNIDEAADGLVGALNSGRAITQKLTSKIGTYNKLVSAMQ